MTPDPNTTPPYSALSLIYDEVMRDVDYEVWADFIDEVIQNRNPDAERLLEIACGTGSIALSLDQLDCYEITACDRSPDMIQTAKAKSVDLMHGVDFHVADFMDLPWYGVYDVVYCTFDSVNYILEPEGFTRLFDSVKKTLKDGGLFIYDFTTPTHSRSAIEYLHDEKGSILQKDGRRIHFHRSSIFDETARLHRNEFLIRTEHATPGTGSDEHRECHLQRIYTLKEMRGFLSSCGVTEVGAYEDFELRPASETSPRITMVCTWP